MRKVVLCLLLAISETALPVVARSRARSSLQGFYLRIVANEIAEDPGIAENHTFVSDYSSLFSCSAKADDSPATPPSTAALVATLKQVPPYVTYTRSLQLERRGNRLTIGPTLAYAESSILFGTTLSGLNQKTPWKTCGSVDWQTSAFPQDVNLIVDNPQALNAISVPANKLRLAHDPKLRIRAKIVSIDTSDQQNIVAHAILQAFTVYGGPRDDIALQHWAASGRYAVPIASPLVCSIKGAPWTTRVALDGNSYVHARLIVKANERLLVAPEEFNALIQTSKKTIAATGYAKLLPFYDNLGHDILAGRDVIDTALQSLTPNDPGESKDAMPQISIGQDFGFISLIELNKGQTAHWIISFKIAGPHRNAHLLTMRWGNYTTCLPER